MASKGSDTITKCGLVEVGVALFEKCVTVVVSFLLKVCFCDKSFTAAWKV